MQNVMYRQLKYIFKWRWAREEKLQYGKEWVFRVLNPNKLWYLNKLYISNKISDLSCYINEFPLAAGFFKYVCDLSGNKGLRPLF